MVKGTQRQMVMVRTSESNLFEMAYFVLRAYTQRNDDEKSMIAEANSIVCAACGESIYSKREKRRRKLRKVALFTAGALFGAAALCIIMLSLGLL